MQIVVKNSLGNHTNFEIHFSVTKRNIKYKAIAAKDLFRGEGLN